MIPTGSDPIGGVSTGRGLKVVLAIVAALALIGISLAIRGALNDDENSGSTRRPDGTDGLPRLGCTLDLRPICQALADEGVIDPEITTLDLYNATVDTVASKVDGWLAWDPASRVLDEANRQNRRWGAAVPVFDAPLAVSTSAVGRQAVADADCSLTAQDLFACLARAAEQGQVSVAAGDPETSEWLVRFAPLTDGYVDGSGDADGTALRAITSTDPRPTWAGESARNQVQPGLGTDVVVGPEAVLQEVAATAGGKQRGLQTRAIPGRRLVVALVPRAGRQLGDLADHFGSKGVVEAAEELGLTPGGERSASQPGQLYVVWREYA